jgi:transposase
MDERLRFVARLLEGEPMTDVCRDFGISRKTGYKIFDRYQEEGPISLCDTDEPYPHCHVLRAHAVPLEPSHGLFAQ